MARPKLKIKDKIFCCDSHMIGTICQIDNLCMLRDHNSTELEYYVKWPNQAWTRHPISDIDEGYDPNFEAATYAHEVLYGKCNKRKTKANRGEV